MNLLPVRGEVRARCDPLGCHHEDHLVSLCHLYRRAHQQDHRRFLPGAVDAAGVCHVDDPDHDLEL